MFIDNIVNVKSILPFTTDGDDDYIIFENIFINK